MGRAPADNWGFFSPEGTWGTGHIEWMAGAPPQLFGIGLSVLLFSTLFWFRPFYRYLARHQRVTIAIGCIYIGFYILYYTLNIVYYFTVFPNTVSGHMSFNPFTVNYHHFHPRCWVPGNYPLPPVSPPQNIFPFHLSSAAQLCAATLLITRNKRLFNVTMPFLGVFPIMAILSPSKIFYGPQNYFYYDYYTNHAVMMIVYWWMYLYGIKHYNVEYLRFNFLFAVGLTGVAFVFDWVANSNLLFVGEDGYPLSMVANTNHFLANPPDRFQALFCVVALGSSALFVSYFIVILKKPFYCYNDQLKSFSCASRVNFKHVKLTLKRLFIWDKKFWYSLDHKYE